MRTFPEPPDGGVLLLRHYPTDLEPELRVHHVWTAIYRDDETAAGESGPDGTPDERWFSNEEYSPRSVSGWIEQLQADAVYALGERLAGEDA